MACAPLAEDGEASALFVRIVLVALSALSLVSTLSPSAALTPDCVAPTEIVELQGPSCRLPDGTWRVFLESGGFVHTHGPDRASVTFPVEPPANAIGTAQSLVHLAPPAMPVCENDPSEYAIEIVLAESAEGTGLNYQVYKNEVLEMFAQANGLLRAESALFGLRGDYKVRCDEDGIPLVTLAHMATSRSDITFGNMVDDLIALGFDSHYEKYAVWYIGGNPAPGFSGQGTLWYDDRAGEDNWNNYGPSWGITYGGLNAAGADTMMHELGHNLGAVQLSAPNTSGAFHCNDGMSIMCYDDGGPQASYRATVCADRLHYDCGHDDYWNPAPTPGSYLATHWNLASPVNHFQVYAPLDA